MAVPGKPGARKELNQDPQENGNPSMLDETCLLPHGTASGLQFDWMHPEELHLTIVSLMI